MLALTLLLGLAGGGVFQWADLPLPWLLGPLLVTAAARISGVALWCPVALRACGQWVIGLALGLYFTPDVLASLPSLWSAVLLAVVFAWSLGIGFATVLHRRGRLDPVTAFFAGAIGSASEMAVQGERHGARVEMIAAVHSIRVTIVVVLLPFLYRWLDLHGTDAYVASRLDVDASGLVLLLIASGAAAGLMHRLRWPNGWVLGPLIVTALMTGTGHAPTALPSWLVIAGQLFIGISLGTRFRPESMRQVRSIVGLVVVTTLAGIAISAAFGAMLAWWLRLPVATMVLATAPGGIAEMSLTAKVLQMGVPIVTVFQVTRMAAMVLTVGWVYRWFERGMTRLSGETR